MEINKFIINHAVMRTKEEQIMNYKFDGVKVFFTSDTHFNHANIIGFCSRPFKNVDEMNETLITNWNRVVGADDIVFHLGDFCLGGSAEWTNVLNRLNGKIYLIVGNHDMKNLRQSYYDRFEEIVMQKHIEIGKQKIYLNHCPFLCYGGAYKDTWQLFGHVHTSKNNTGKDASRLNMLFPTQYDVGVDNNNFTPVSFDQVEAIIQKQVEQFNKNNRNGN
jgi:calcineurin-like phosphoesterase family protein